MARPSIIDVFGINAVWQESPFPGTPGGLFLPENLFYEEGESAPTGGPDAQQALWKIIIRASLQLNEANRNNNADGIRTTITYGEFDAIIDPPGSTNVFRRDVFSLLAYQPQVYQTFNPENV